ncbi:class I SAM-dependent methyltransferase [Alicyclobacillus hesperidum]|uniref:class I SAM-dependent methyltransferase n=1 Tax=Alicyclobacillus hesperidum TaxID=89784 RepID=UPI0024936195|nr:methyltransferase domain-containing protein [Alicyclobacillus hesperidum]
MNSLHDRFQAIDSVWQAYTQQRDLPHHWLLEQTLKTALTRRAILPVLHIQEGMKVLDLGTGFGALAFDIAASSGVVVHAMDHDMTAIELATSMLADIQASQGLHPLSQVTCEVGDVYQLPYSNDTFDYVVSRFVFQHLSDPQHALQEIFRVLRPGGLVCIIDIDDQLSITYPEEPTAFVQLRSLFAKLQSLRGGDRIIGRKIPIMLHSNGFQVVNTLVLPQAQFSFVSHDGMATQMAIQQFMESKEHIIANRLITNEEFERLISELHQDSGRWSYVTNSELITIGKRP